jgi:hypothetical protein
VSFIDRIRRKVLSELGLAIGTGGLFRDGVRIGHEAEAQLSGPGSVAVRYLPLELRLRSRRG